MSKVEWSCLYDPKSWATPDLWMPIISAPQEVDVLVWNGIRRVVARSYMGSWMMFREDGGYQRVPGPPPSHWMPLPATPTP